MPGLQSRAAGLRVRVLELELVQSGKPLLDTGHGGSAKQRARLIQVARLDTEGWPPGYTWPAAAVSIGMGRTPSKCKCEWKWKCECKFVPYSLVIFI